MVENEQYVIAYFGRQADYYVEKYKEFHSGNRFTFNIAAFFAGLFWFIYRKMYLYFVLIFASSLLLGIIEGVIYEMCSVSEGIQSLAYFLGTAFYATLFGFVGNYLYLKNADKEIKKVLQLTEDEEERIRLLGSKGGVSLVPFIVLLVIVFFMVLINNF